MQKSSRVAGDWFLISTAECIGLMLNPKTNANKAGAIGLFSEKYNDQIRSAANMESQSAAASGLIGCKESYSQWNRRIHFYVIDPDDTTRLICVLAAIFNLRFLSHKQHFLVLKGKYWSIAVKMEYIPTAHNLIYT